MAIGTNVNTIRNNIGGRHELNDITRVNIAPTNTDRVRIDIMLDCDLLTHCIEVYDAETDGQLIAILDREFQGVMIRNRDFYTMDINAIIRGDLWAIITDGPSPYDIVAIEYTG